MTTMATRFWFRNADVWVPRKGEPYVLVGILASSWDEATEVACIHPDAKPLLTIAPAHYFLGCNVTQMVALPCDDVAEVLVKHSPAPTTPKVGLNLKKTSGAAKRAAA
jgi:hypothetical protein